MGEDYVNVRLTKFGESLKQVVVHAGGTQAPDGHGMRHREFIFKPGDVLHVTRAFEWDRILARENIDGKPLFELVPDVAAVDAANLRKLGIDAYEDKSGHLVEDVPPVVGAQKKGGVK